MQNKPKKTKKQLQKKHYISKYLAETLQNSPNSKQAPELVFSFLLPSFQLRSNVHEVAAVWILSDMRLA